MNPRLHATFLKHHDHALKVRPERDIEPALNALGTWLWIAAIGDEQRITPQVTKSLTALARRTQLALRTQLTDADEDTARVTQGLLDIARAALQLLEGKDIGATKPPIASTKLHPATRTLAKMLEGTADGITSGRYALHVLRCARCQAELEVMPPSKNHAEDDDASVAGGSTMKLSMNLAEPSATYRLAAAEVTQVRAPGEGRVIAAKKKPALEAVLFNDTDARRLAIYSTDDAGVRVVAKGLTTEGTLAGYWIGRLDAGLTSIEAQVHVDDRTVKWKLALAIPRPKKK